MTAKPMPPIPQFNLTEEQLQKIAGAGDVCSADDWQRIFDSLGSYYESLVGFTSYVIERVATSTT